MRPDHLYWDPPVTQTSKSKLTRGDKQIVCISQGSSYMCLMTYHIEDSLEFWVIFTFGYHWKIVTKSSQTVLKLVVIKLTTAILIKVPGNR